MEDLRALRSGICSDKEREKCAAEFGDNLEWVCGKCEKKRSAEDLELHEYTAKMLRVRLLRAGGYPFRADDLTPEEWEDQGKIEQWLLTPER